MLVTLQVQDYRRDFDRLKQRIQSALPSSERAQLGPVASDDNQVAARQRERLLTSTAQLEKTGRRLTESRQAMADIEVSHAEVILEHTSLGSSRVLRDYQQA
jgi:hypothetical protein